MEEILGIIESISKIKNINVIVIQVILASDNEKFLNTLLKASRISRPNNLNAFIFIFPFLIIFKQMSFFKGNNMFLFLINNCNFPLSNPKIIQSVDIKNFGYSE